ncbi:unnamed protein product [Ectocarpus sp. 13 AM-2016]
MYLHLRRAGVLTRQTGRIAGLRMPSVRMDARTEIFKYFSTERQLQGADAAPLPGVRCSGSERTRMSPQRWGAACYVNGIIIMVFQMCFVRRKNIRRRILRVSCAGAEERTVFSLGGRFSSSETPRCGRRTTKRLRCRRWSRDLSLLQQNVACGYRARTKGRYVDPVWCCSRVTTFMQQRDAEASPQTAKSGAHDAVRPSLIYFWL